MYATPRSTDADRGGRGDLIQQVRGNKSPSGHYRALTSSPADSPASLFLSQDLEKVPKIAATSGRKWLDALPSSVLDTWSGRMLTALLGRKTWRTFSSKYYLTWKPSTTKYSRLLFRLEVLERITDDTGSGFWPTPSTADRGSEGTGELYETQTGTIRRKNENGTSSNMGLEATAIHRGQAETGPSPGPLASGFAPTPQSRDWKGSSGRSYKGEEVDRPTFVNSNKSGRLSVSFVEWLMGYPQGWTDIPESETEPPDSKPSATR